MAQIKEISEALRKTQFLEKLLEEFVIRGLGSLPGRETTITLVDLLLKHHPDWVGTPPADYEIARLLRTSPRKIRNIRDELSYRDTSRDDKWCKERLIEVLKNAEQIRDGAYVAIQISDGLVRDYAQKVVHQNYGLFEQGFRSDVVKLSGETFAGLVISLMPDKEQVKLLKKIPKKEQEKHQVANQDKGPIRLFVDSFASSAGSEAGKQSVKLGFTILTGGLNLVGEALDVVKNVVNED